MSPLTSGYEKVLFLFELLLELLNQEDRVMKRAITRVMKHNPILHGAMPPIHRRESCMRDREVFLLSTVTIPDIFLVIRSMHHSSFLVLPSFRKSQDKISFKGEGGNTPCYRNHNQVN
jgi:hypothetical protein